MLSTANKKNKIAPITIIFASDIFPVSNTPANAANAQHIPMPSAPPTATPHTFLEAVKSTALIWHLSPNKYNTPISDK